MSNKKVNKFGVFPNFFPSSLFLSAYSDPISSARRNSSPTSPHYSLVTRVHNHLSFLIAFIVSSSQFGT